jgi:N-acylneuraminate cytidylyltransferase
MFIIPARGGSKGIPGKNIKLLNEKPLICHSIDMARRFVADEHIYISTDDATIEETVLRYGLPVPYHRPPELASDTSGMTEVLSHLFQWCRQNGKQYSEAVLLQPTSPFRKEEHVRQALENLNTGCDLSTSVKVAEANPYYLHYLENPSGHLEKLLQAPSINRRQDAPVVFELNGAVYAFRIAAFEKYGAFSNFEKITKVLMDPVSSLDLDTLLDWDFAEFLIHRKYIV